MSSAGPVREALLRSMDGPDHYRRDPAELAEAQLQAAQELFEQRVDQVALLKRRADDADIRRIDRLEDLVPLLFPHTSYKSYPQTLIDKGQWDRLLKWLGSLSVDDLSDVDLEGVRDIDGWVDRLWAAGHEVMATSGTSGKCSFLNRNLRDRETQKRYLSHVMGDFVGLSPAADRPVFQMFPASGPNNGVLSARINADLWGRPGDIHFLSEEPLLVSETSRGAALRQRMAAGTASPDEITRFEAETAGKAQRMRARLDELIALILEKRHQPIFLSGQWSQHWAIVQKARALGITDGDFHPDSLVAAGGGTKGIVLPEDYEAQINRFYGEVKRPKNYGMTEMLLLFPRCEAQRYHQPAGVIPLLLNGEADALLPRSGQVEGRFGFLDLSIEGRWGGVISGDRVRMDFSGTCPCGRRGPTLLEPITRYAAPGQEDHIGCAGTIDAYLRGSVQA